MGCLPRISWRRPRHGDGAVQAEADFVQRKVEKVGRAQAQPRQRRGKGVAQVPRPRVRTPRLRDEQQVHSVHCRQKRADGATSRRRKEQTAQRADGAKSRRRSVESVECGA